MKKLKSNKKTELRKLSVRVPLDLYEALHVFKEELRAFDETMLFDVDELLAIALRRDLQIAKQELQSLKQIPLKPPPVQQSTLTPAPAVTPAPITTPAPAATPAPTMIPNPVDSGVTPGRPRPSFSESLRQARQHPIEK